MVLCEDSNSNYKYKQSNKKTSCKGRKDLNPSLEQTMKTSKRDCRKPEIEIYRPGKGLQNKISKSDDRCEPSFSNSVSPSDDCILGQLNALDTSSYLEQTKHIKHHSSKSSKNNRNRRPDIQVYTPKPKIAQLNEKKSDNTSQPSVKVDFNGKSGGKDSPILNIKEDFEAQCKIQETSKIINSKCNKLVSTKYSNSNSPLPTENCEDLIESDVSNSRSSPDKLCNGDMNNLNAYSAQKADERNMKRRQKSKQRSNEDNKKNRINQHSKKHDYNYPSSNNGFTKEQLDNDQSTSNDKSRYKQCKQKPPDLGIKENLSKEEKYDSVQVRNNVFDSKIKSEKKKRLEQTLPPRFQKNKNQDSHNLSKYNSSSGGSGGIIKLPVDFDRSVNHTEPIDSSLYVHNMYHQEPQIYIHKQLFDPNNPSKPEIINIPAPHPVTHMPYANMNDDYYNTDSSTSFIPQPIQNVGYIPPPQPPGMNRQFYGLPDVSINNGPDNFIKRDVIPPPVPNPVYCHASGPYGIIPPPVPPPGTKRLKPVVENCLREISHLERELSSLLAKGLNEENMEGIMHYRYRLKLRYEEIIVADPTYCAERNPEQSLWKSVFYQIIELYRKKLEENPTDEIIKEQLLRVIHDGSYFCQALIEKLEETYGFDLNKLMESDIINMATVPERIRIILISMQKLHIYLGDLARYNEQVNKTSNYGKARSYYLKASQIHPKNGRPYYQLALIAVSVRRKLDAVYFYVRSLSASNPILSAKESLLTLFEEAKRKYEMYEKKRSEETLEEVESLDKDIGERFEIWIKPDGSSNQAPFEMDKNLDSSDVKNLSDVELNKRFVTSFLHVHGKLYTKIGMETFPDTLNQMLKEFYFLLQRTPLPITSSRLLILLAINIFSVENSSSKENGREHGAFSLLQEQALYTSMSMMSLLMERCHMLHIAHKSSPEYSSQMVSDDLAELLPSAKIWTDWMSCQKSFWPSPPNSVMKALNVGFTKNIWVSFADLLTVLREIDLKLPETSNVKDEECDTLILEEDAAFAGFVPLLGTLQDPIYIHRPYDKVLAKHCVRINRIQFFGDYLCGITPPCMQFDVESKKFVSLVDQIYTEERFEGCDMHKSYDDVKRKEDIVDNLRGRVFHDDSETSELQLLWSKKEALSKTKEKQEKYKAEVQAVLQKHQSQRSIVLKIKPKYLIPDTNCFIDHLRLFRNILALSSYQLIVPLVVINELDGLSRGTRVNERTSPQHANRVTALSREAMFYLEEQFAQKNPCIKAITSKGSILDTISFRSEEMGSNKGTNDDLILSCCLYYCKDRPEEFMPQSPRDSVTLSREVVLLTDDRNLRVKALAHHVPVRDLQSFLQWANS